ncbi:MAG: hypothetical protein HC817_15655, partial [Saprospiraceae bacterium]|nr:hypothetical protein [Saprospiraceae bacterium]
MFDPNVGVRIDSGTHKITAILTDKCKNDSISRDIKVTGAVVVSVFTPDTIIEMMDAMRYSRETDEVGVVVITGEGDKAFCSGGDQNIKGHGGYVGKDGVPRLNVLDLQ